MRGRERAPRPRVSSPSYVALRTTEVRCVGMVVRDAASERPRAVQGYAGRMHRISDIATRLRRVRVPRPVRGGRGRGGEGRGALADGATATLLVRGSWEWLQCLQEATFAGWVPVQMNTELSRRDEHLPSADHAQHISQMAESAVDLKTLRQLSVAERIQLVEDLWDSIAEEAPDDAFPVSAELAAELDRRLAEADANPSAGVEWSEVRRAIETRTLRLEP